MSDVWQILSRVVGFKVIESFKTFFMNTSADTGPSEI
jgi:hypothetical protein